MAAVSRFFVFVTDLGCSVEYLTFDPVYLVWISAFVAFFNAFLSFAFFLLKEWRFAGDRFDHALLYLFLFFLSLSVVGRG